MIYLWALSSLSVPSKLQSGEFEHGMWHLAMWSLSTPGLKSNPQSLKIDLCFVLLSYPKYIVTFGQWSSLYWQESSWTFSFCKTSLWLHPCILMQANFTFLKRSQNMIQLLYACRWKQSSLIKLALPLSCFFWVDHHTAPCIVDTCQSFACNLHKHCDHFCTLK